MPPVILLIHMRGAFEKMTREATHASQGRRPVHSREVLLPLTRDEIRKSGYLNWRLRYPSAMACRRC